MAVATQRGLATVRYTFDKAASRFTVQAFSAGLLSAFGHNPTISIANYEGRVEFIPGTYAKALVTMAVKTASLNVLDEMRREDRQKLEQLMFHDVLDVDEFPATVYESTQVDVTKVSDGLLQVALTGDLTLRGVTQPHRFRARVMDMGGTLRIYGDFTLNQSDFGIKPISFAGGALRLKDELKFNFEIVARHDE
jgi:polyisoprenoid-binding protein YceI